MAPTDTAQTEARINSACELYINDTGQRDHPLVQGAFIAGIG